MKKEIDIFDKFEDIEEYISDKSRKLDTLMEISKTDDKDIRTLSLKRGSFDGAEPWFIVDENQKLHTMISIDSIHKLIKNFKELQQDNFDLKLEKTILQHVPIDFQDVWTVAIDEIKKFTDKSNDAKNLNIDLEKLLKRIKKEHPNLFLNLKDLFMGQNMPTNV